MWNKKAEDDATDIKKEYPAKIIAEILHSSYKAKSGYKPKYDNSLRRDTWL